VACGRERERGGGTRERVDVERLGRWWMLHLDATRQSLPSQTIRAFSCHHSIKGRILSIDRHDFFFRTSVSSPRPTHSSDGNPSGIRQHNLDMVEVATFLPVASSMGPARALITKTMGEDEGGRVVSLGRNDDGRNAFCRHFACY